MRIVFHVGAHKTATTYIQNALEASARTLRDHHVGYVPLAQMRSAITPLISRLRPGLGRRIREAARECGDCHRLILSDENILGRNINRNKPGPYYPRHRQRLRKTVSAVAEKPEIFLAIRSYDEFISSMYSEYIRHYIFMSPAEYLSCLHVDEFSWLDVVRNLCDLVGEERVTAWRYEDFNAVENEVFQALCGIDPNLLTKPEGRVRESHSQQAIEALTDLRPALDGKEIRSRVPSVSEAFPRSATNPPFAIFPAQRSAELRQRYDSDIAAMRREFPQMAFLQSATNTI